MLTFVRAVGERYYTFRLTASCTLNCADWAIVCFCGYVVFVDFFNNVWGKMIDLVK